MSRNAAGGRLSMIVQSLARYMTFLQVMIRSRSQDLDIAWQKVSLALVISPEGVLTNILDLRTDGKKKLPKGMEVPCKKALRKTLSTYFLCDKESMCSVLKA